MALPYVAQTWTNASAGGTPVSAGRLGHIETGIDDASDAIIALQSDASTGTAWASYTPTLTNITLGNGTLSCAYARYGKTIFGRFKFTMGTTSAMGTSPTFTLPVAMRNSGDPFNATALIDDSGTGRFICAAFATSTTVVELGLFDTATAYNTITFISSTRPMTWTTNDAIRVGFVYEAA